MIRLIFIILFFLLGCAKPQNGAPGSIGPQGSAGTDAAQVSAVKFCPNATTVYPSSFPEYGFCILGHLYATYWDGHNAWTVEVVPGHYTSTSTSAACSFTVLPNCGVTL